MRHFDRPRHLPVCIDVIVASCRRALDDREESGQSTDQYPRRPTDDGEGIGVPLLRHEHTGTGVGAGQLHIVELLAVPDLEVLRQLALVGHEARCYRQQRDQHVGLPHGIPGVLDDPVEAERRRDPSPVGEEPGTVDAPGAAGAQIHRGELGEHAAAIADRRRREPQHVVPERGRLGMLEIRLVRHVGLGMLRSEFRNGIDEIRRVDHQLARHSPKHQPDGHTGGFASGSARVQPPSGVTDLLGEVFLAAVVGLSETTVVRELLGRRLMRVEEHAHEVPGGGCRDKAPRLEIQDVSHVGDVETVVEVGRIGDLRREAGIDQLLSRSQRRRTREPALHRLASRLILSIAVTAPPVCHHTMGPEIPSVASEATAVSDFAA